MALASIVSGVLPEIMVMIRGLGQVIGRQRFRDGGTWETFSEKQDADSKWRTTVRLAINFSVDMYD